MSEAGKSSLTIGEVSKATGLSVYTLRYYERAGLIPPVERDPAGRRVFTTQHVRWFGLLDRLRTSGMSIRRMKEYATLVRKGDASLDQRRRLLCEHAADIGARIAELEETLAIVRAKIALYEGHLTDANVVWDLVARARRDESMRDLSGLRTPR